jgi:hypothetical protein
MSTPVFFMVEKHIQRFRMVKEIGWFHLRKGRESEGQVRTLEFRE